MILVPLLVNEYEEMFVDTTENGDAEADRINERVISPNRGRQG